MLDSIKNFAKQFSYEPEIENAARLKAHRKFLVAGMGGSHLGAGLLKIWKPDLDLVVWSDYGLPPLAEGQYEDRLFIASSYSGNTEETIDALEAARRKGMACAAVAAGPVGSPEGSQGGSASNGAGGELIARAKRYGIPYVELPDLKIQPRMAVPANMRAILALIGEKEGLRESARLADTLKPAAFEAPGKALAKKLKGKAPVIYASARNAAIAYNWKIKFNETGKIPAFMNVAPELNHNEMTGFDAIPATRKLSERMHFILLEDAADDPRILRRFRVMRKLYAARKFVVSPVPLEGKSVFEKIFSSLILADWTAYHTSKIYGTEPEQVPMVEEFKELIKAGASS